MYLTWITDSVGKQYLGIKVDEYLIKNFLDKMKDYLGSSYDKYRSNQIRRDGEKFHITVVSNSEIESSIKRLGKEKFNDILNTYQKRIYNCEFYGLGQISHKYEQTVYIIVNDPILTSLRFDLGFDKKDFHITLGFRNRDIHHLSKGVTSVIKEECKFIQLLRQNFYNNENLSWVFNLPGWNFDKNIESLIPIKVSDKYLTVYYDGYIMDIGEAGDELKILTQYKGNFTKSITSIEIREFLNKI